jgi:hypothetical protein
VFKRWTLDARNLKMKCPCERKMTSIETWNVYVQMELGAPKQSNEIMNCPFLKRVINIKQNKLCMRNVHLWMEWWAWNKVIETWRVAMSMCEKNNEIGTPNETIETWNVHMWVEQWVPNEVSTCEHKGGHLVKQLKHEKIKCEWSKGLPNEANLDKRCLGMCDSNNEHLLKVLETWHILVWTKRWVLSETIGMWWHIRINEMMGTKTKQLRRKCPHVNELMGM